MLAEATGSHLDARPRNVTAPARRRLASAVIATLVSSAVVAVAPAPHAAHAASVVEVTAWAPYWEANDALASFTANSSMFAELTPFFFSAIGAGTIVVNPNMSKQLAQTVLPKYRAAADTAGTPLVATVVDAMPPRAMAAVLADPATRTQHVQALLAFAVNGGYDGLDIDYEQFAFSDGRDTWAATRPNWAAFITELANALHVAGRTLSVAVPPIYDSGMTNASGYWVYDFATLGAVVDRVRVMTYSYSVGKPGPIAPYAWVSSSMDAARALVPPSKLEMGIPAYGTDWVTSIEGSCPVGVAPKKKNITVEAAAQYAYDRGVVPAWDAQRRERTYSYVDSFTGPDVTGVTVRCNVSRTVWYVDADGIHQRVLLAQSKNLVGVALWALGYDDPATWTGIQQARANQAWQSPPAAVPPPRPAPGPPIYSAGPLPSRYLDTRPDGRTGDGLSQRQGAVPAGTTIEVPIAGRGAVPGEARAVTLNVTAIGNGDGFVTIYPCGERPTTSNLNVTDGQIISNSVITRLSDAGSVCLYTQAEAQLIVDVFNVIDGDDFSPLDAPARLADTRPNQVTIDGRSLATGMLGVSGVLEVRVAGRGGVDDEARTAVFNVTAVDAPTDGFLTLWDCDGPRPATSNVNFAANDPLPNAVISALSDRGTVCVFASNPVHVVVDVFGSLGDGYAALAQPARVMDTRPGTATVDGQFAAFGKAGAGWVMEIPVAGRGETPLGASAVLNVTVDDPELDGFVSAYPCGTARPIVSNVNFAPDQILSNLVVAKLGGNGAVCVFTLVPTHLIIDVFGVFDPVNS